jgi:hypothetical protein
MNLPVRFTELEVTSNTGEVEPLKLADGQVLYIKPNYPKVVRFSWEDFQYHLRDCRCDLCQQ